MDRLPTLKERAIESAQELLDAHAASPAHQDVEVLPCEACARARKLIEAFKERPQ